MRFSTAWSTAALLTLALAGCAGSSSRAPSRSNPAPTPPPAVVKVPMTGQWTVQPNETATPLSPGQQLAGGDTLRIDGTTLVELRFGSGVVPTSHEALVDRYGVGLMDYGNFCADGVVEYWFTYQNPQAIGDQPRTASYGIHVTTSERTGQVAAGFEAYELTTPNQPTPRRVQQPLRLLQLR